MPTTPPSRVRGGHVAVDDGIGLPTALVDHTVGRGESAAKTSGRAELASVWRARSALVPASYLAVFSLWMLHVWTNPGAIVAGLPRYEDTLQALWYLSWWPHALTHLGNPFFTTLLNYPGGVNLEWMGIGAPLVGFLGWPITALWGPVTAYNVLLALGVTVSAWAVYFAVRPWVRHASAAYVAGLSFLICPYIVGQSLGHIALVIVPLVPLSLVWANWALVRERGTSRVAGITLGGLLAAQFLISEEVAASLLLMLGLGCVWLAILYPRAVRERLGRGIRIALWAAAVTAIFLVGPVAWQYLGPGVIHGPVMPPAQFSGRLLGFVLPGITQLLSTTASSHLITVHGYNVVEFGTYLGVPLLIVVLVLAVLRWRMPIVRVSVLMLITAAVLLLGARLHLTGEGPSGLPLPWLVLGHIPPLGDVLPVRLSLYLDLFAVVLLGIAFDQALQKKRWMWGVLAAFCVGVSWVPAPLLMPVENYSTPQFFTHPLDPAGQVLLVVPFAQSYNESTAMEWQATAQMSFSMVDGYYSRTTGLSGNFYHGPRLNLLTWDLWTLEHGGYGPGPVVYKPLGFTPIVHWLGSRTTATVHADPIITHALLNFVAGYLSQHHVNSVVLGPCPHHQALEQFLVKVFGPAQQVQGVSLWDRPPGGWTTLAIGPSGVRN